MKIAHIETSLNWGGQELRIVEQMEWFSEHGYTVWLIARPESEIIREARERQLLTYPVTIRNAFNPIVIYKIAKFLRKNQIDLVDIHSSKESITVFFIKLLTNIKIIRSRHISNPIKHDLIHKLIWQYGNHRVITTAEAIKRQLIDKKLKSPDKIDVAIAGVDDRRFYPELRSQNQELKRHLNIPIQHYVIANIGMIREDKGQLFFIRACHDILKKINNISFIQIGEATASSQGYKQSILREIQQLGLKSRIQLLGYRADIENYLSISDIVVIASIGTEGQTRLVSQAFMTKTAVVATTVGGLTEMIEDQQTGILCEPNSPETLAKAVITLLENRNFYDKITKNAHNHAIKQLTFDKMMENMLKFYQRC